MTGTSFLSQPALLSWDKARGSKCSQQGLCQSQNSKVTDLCRCFVAVRHQSLSQCLTKHLCIRGKLPDWQPLCVRPSLNPTLGHRISAALLVDEDTIQLNPARSARSNAFNVRAGW